jgi:two-component system response regulator (stage 0 sporulation protein A)
MTDFYIEQILQKLHIRKRYCGYRLLFRAVALALEDEARLLNVKNQIYQPIADSYGCKASNVERNIRTVISLVWENWPGSLQQIVKYPLYGPPSASEMIEIIMTYIQRTYLISLI